MKELFKALLGTHVQPLLKAAGFRKKGLNFYLRRDGLIFMLNFQLSHGNSADQLAFYINCGIHAPQIDQLLSLEAREEPKEYECLFHARIDSLTGSGNDKFMILSSLDPPRLGPVLEQEIRDVLAFFGRFHSDQDLVEYMVPQGGLLNYEVICAFLALKGQMETLAMFVKGLHGNFGHECRWMIFAEKMDAILEKYGRKERVEDYY